VVDTVVDRPERVVIDVLESGPVRARLLVTAQYRWPTHAVGDEHSCSRRSDDMALTDVRTTLELRAGERFLRVRVELDHRTRDHRLRAHFPLDTPVEGSHAECAFAVVTRGLTAEGGPHEAGLPTFVSRRFVDCSDGETGLALLHDGLLEYEVINDGDELALTLLRATGYLSRSAPALRPNPAGPLDRLEGPQLQRPLALDYAILPHRGDWRAADLPDAADDFLVPLERVRGGAWAGATRPPTGTALANVDLAAGGARVSALLRDERGARTMRLVNLHDGPSDAHVDGAGHRIDLVGRELEAFDGSLTLRPWEIATVRLDG
jgi:alpha-mannosidase